MLGLFIFVFFTYSIIATNRFIKYGGGNIMGINETIAKIRFKYHANMLDINGVLNQLHLMSDDKCEESNKRHCMTIFNDIFPRMGLDVSSLMKKETEEES